jgi:DNA-directed RNA polymerase specialized sigma subunit
MSALRVEDYCGLAIYWAKKLWRWLPEVEKATVELRDLVQERLVGLLEGKRHYDARQGAFATFASARVHGAIIDHLRRGHPLTARERARCSAFLPLSLLMASTPSS